MFSVSLHRFGVLTLSLAACSVHAQVVIEERVEVVPERPSVDSLAADSTGIEPSGGGDPATRGSAARGDLLFYFNGAYVWVHGLSSLTFTVATSQKTTSFSASSGSTLRVQEDHCQWSEDYADCEAFSYDRQGDGLMASVPISVGEEIHEIRLTGPGAHAVITNPSFPSVTTGFAFQVNCTYIQNMWGGPPDLNMCQCMDEVDPGAVHGTVGVQWRFEADPPDHLDVWLAPDTLDYTPMSPRGSSIHVVPLYADGTPAPLRWGSPLSYSTSTPWGNLLVQSCSYGTCQTRGYGQSAQGHHAMWSASFVADGKGGGGDPQMEGPLCDEAVDVRVQMVDGPASGTGEVVIRGSGAPASDTLIVSVHPPLLAPGDSAAVSARYYPAECLGEELAGDNLMTVSISADDSVYGSLHYGEQNGDVINVFYDAIKAGEVFFVADGVTPLRLTEIVIAVAGGGAEGEGQTAVEGAADFDVVPQPDTIYAPPGAPSKSSIVVIARDRKGEEVSLPAETTVTLSIPSSYLDFGVTFATPHSGHVAEVPYVEARNGSVSLEAITPPSGDLRVPVTAVSSGESTLTGDSVVVVVDPASIRMTLSEAEVWPRLPRGGLYHRVGLDPVDDTVDEVLVHVYDGEGGLEGVDVRVVAEWVQGSGAHAHEESGKYMLEPAGTFTDPTSGQSLGGQISAPTDEEGNVRFAFRAPEFGGRIKMLAFAVVSGDTLEADEEVTVRVPGLQALPHGGDYVKIGGTQDHHGPPGYSDDDNHWAHPSVVTNLQDIAREWAEMDSLQAPLKINDLSLPLGGAIRHRG